MPQTTAAATAAANDEAPRGQEQVDRLVAALARHGFEATAESPWFCQDSDGRPCIPMFRMQGTEVHQDRLTELIVGFYENGPMPELEQPVDTTLKVAVVDDDEDSTAYDTNVDRELEIQYVLTFGGAEILALMPIEIFSFTEDLGRTIEQRYFDKIGRFADYLMNRNRS